MVALPEYFLKGATSGVSKPPMSRTDVDLDRKRQEP